MIANTGFPEYIESIAIGSDIDFLKNNTSLCDIAEDFNIELQLAYKWKRVMASSLILPELRNYVKFITANGPEIDTETLIYFTEKINRIPSRFKYKVLDELDSAFNKADKFIPITDPVTDFSNDQIDNDRDFLGKLSNLLKDCNSPCNYFKAYGDSIGTIFDISRNNNTNTEPSSADNSKPPATHIGMNIFNKLHNAIRDSYAEMCARAGAVWDEVKSDKPSIVRSDTSAYTSIANVYSDALSKVKRRTQDCFRLYDYNNRYSAYNSQMNLGLARNKFFKIATQIGFLDGKTITREINSAGEIRNHHKPTTNAVDALDNYAQTNADDFKFNTKAISSVTAGLSGTSTPVKSGEIHFTTYGLYDKLAGKGDPLSNKGYGQGNIDLEADYIDSDGKRITLVALSDAAKEKYGFTELGERFTLQDPNGTTKTFMYVDRSGKSEVNIDIADYKSTTDTAAEAASLKVDNNREFASYFTAKNERVNTDDLILTKIGKEPNLKYKK